MTDEDKNLLELAARAAGFADGWVIQGWNPLIDSGDALNLAVKLGLTLVVESDMVFCRNQRSDKAFDDEAFDDFAEDVEDNECHNCSGTGEGMYDSQSCVVCLGKGFL